MEPEQRRGNVEDGKEESQADEVVCIYSEGRLTEANPMA